MSKNGNSAIAYYRLLNQQIAWHNFKTPADIVSWMGITQAQDYSGAKWSIGLRLPDATDTSIEQAVADRNIVRSWSFRGTLHFMHPTDIRPMLQLAAPRLLSSFSTRLRSMELDKTTLSKSRTIMAGIMKGGKHLTRKEIMAAIQKKNISTEGLRSNFLMLCAALEGLICCGVRRNKEFTYTLLDEWLPPTPKMARDEILAMLALRYFTSHGPATIQDFAWWLGITLADAKAGHETVKHKLVQETINGQTYYLPNDMPSSKPSFSKIFILSGFDEYLLGYKDRSAVMTPEFTKIVVGAGNGLFSATVIADGQVAGIWKRTLKKEAVIIDTSILTHLTKTQNKSLNDAVNVYSRFIRLPLI